MEKTSESTDSTRSIPTAGDTVIAVMGVTGVGKSTFINHFSDEQTVIGHGLEACTGKVEVYPSTLPNKTKLFLVDTPGFDDTYRSDTDILKEIANWLSTAYEDKIKLAGIVYLHRIEDVRLGGAGMRNLRMFKALCGDNSLASVVLATTRWRNVDPDEGLLREQQLCSSPKMWKRMIDYGSKVMRQDRDEDSAYEILQYLLQRRKPVTLDIQVELVDNKKSLNETGAGQELHAELEKQKKEYEKQLAALRQEMEDAMKKMDADLKEQLQAEKDDLERRLREAREHDRQLEATREEIRQQMALEAQRERNELQEQLRQAERQLVREEVRLQQQQERHKYTLQHGKLEAELQQKRNENAALRLKLQKEESGCVVM
ncbi:P-loop containing nucleoside triphosphate hydrolase protein [Phaeosphaeria sp. MPI-PUGE-AT-0046c]|nr:P-loop containing nucleoside triphosphate hydrolase protein [Phaeosphaeria sp. MPI-PUGE-AT-0046c]